MCPPLRAYSIHIRKHTLTGDRKGRPYTVPAYIRRGRRRKAQKASPVQGEVAKISDFRWRGCGLPRAQMPSQ